MICPQCNKEFVPSKGSNYHRQKHCSKKCTKQKADEKYRQTNKGIEAQRKGNKKVKDAKEKVFIICPECNKEFVQSTGSPKCCSKTCAKEALKKYGKSEKRIEGRKKSYRLKGWETTKNYKQSDKYKKYLQSDNRKETQKKHQQSEKYEETKQKYQKSEEGRVVIRKYANDRMKSDPIFKLGKNIRNRLNEFLKRKNITKRNKTFKIVGCTPEFLKEYLEKQFKSGMTWKNHTLDGWHVDHRIPLSSGQTIDEVEKLSHYTNLQPMWAIENIKKSNKII